MGRLIIQQSLDCFQMMDILGQYTESKILVMIDYAGNKGTIVGHLSHMVPSHNCVKGSIAFVPGKHVNLLKGKINEGFVFTYSSGQWYITRSKSEATPCKSKKK